MSFESFQLNLKLTNTGYNKVMALDGKPVALKYIALGKGNAAGTAGYNVDFRDTKTALLHEVVRKKIDSSQKTSYTDANGTPLARLDFAAIFNDSSSFDVWEMGFFDDVGDLIYIWSHPSNVFAPKRPNIHLAISISQHLLFAEEAAGVVVQDAGVPFELFLQPLKDDLVTYLAYSHNAIGDMSLSAMAEHTEKMALQKEFSALNANLANLANGYQSSITQLQQTLLQLTARIDADKSAQTLFNAHTHNGIGALSLSTM